MMKLINNNTINGSVTICIAAITVMWISSCTAADGDTTYKAIYRHEVRGEVLEDDAVFIEATEDCRAKTFNQPVYVDGKAVVSHKKLLEIRSGYSAKDDNERGLMPAYILEIDLRQRNLVSCIREEKGYSHIGVNIYDKKSGALVETFEMEDI